MNIFSKFFISFGNKKNKYLPAPSESIMKLINENIVEYPVNPYKTIASFDLNIQEPAYMGAIPDATIKFYPLD